MFDANRRHGLTPERAALLAAALAVLPTVQTGCGPGERTALDTVLPYLEAVQAEDLDTLYCLSAGAAAAPELGATDEERRVNFERWARERFRIYRDGRDEGWVELADDGIVLVKLFSLGRGTFFTYEGSRPLTGEAVEVDTHLRFGYSNLDLASLSPGTTFYLAGDPPGRVYPVLVPDRREEVDLEVLDTVTVRWTLVRQEGNAACPAGWTVAGAVPVDGTQNTTHITWVF